MELKPRKAKLGIPGPMSVLLGQFSLWLAMKRALYLNT